MTTVVATTAVVGCPDCGTRQELSPLEFGDTLYCVTCHSPLERRYGQSLTAALCCASATLLLLIPANVEIFLTTEAFGASRHSYLSSTAGAILDGGWPWLALALFLFVVVFPIVRFTLLTLVLGHLYLNRHHRWLGRAFRWANRLETWAMLDVFLLALAVTYVRIKPVISVHLGDGAIFLMVAGVLSLLTRAVLDKAAVWQAISPDCPPDDPRSAVACLECDLLVAAERTNTPCPRCAAILRHREVEYSDHVRAHPGLAAALHPGEPISDRDAADPLPAPELHRAGRRDRSRRRGLLGPCAAGVHRELRHSDPEAGRP